MAAWVSVGMGSLGRWGVSDSTDGMAERMARSPLAVLNARPVARPTRAAYRGAEGDRIM